MDVVYIDIVFKFPVEVNRLFTSYGAEASRRSLSRRNHSARPRSSFTRVFCCLSSMTQSVAPAKSEKEELEAAGLGEKKVTFLVGMVMIMIWFFLFICFQSFAS